MLLAFELKSRVKPRFREVTSRFVKHHFCIILNGRLVTRPVLMTPLPGSGIIEGIGDHEDRKMLVATIKAGALKVIPILVREETIPPSRG